MYTQEMDREKRVISAKHTHILTLTEREFRINLAYYICNNHRNYKTTTKYIGICFNQNFCLHAISNKHETETTLVTQKQRGERTQNDREI